MESEKDLKQAILLNSTAVFTYYLIQWIITVVVTRLLGYTDAGIYTLAVSFSNIFYFISNFGLRNIQISDTNRTVDRNSYLTSRIITSFISFIVFSVAVTISHYDKTTILCCAGMMIYKIMESYSDVLMGEMQLENHYDYIAKSYLIKSFVVLISITITLFVSRSLITGIIGMCFAYFLVLFFYDFRVLSICPGFKWNNKCIKYLLKTGFPLMIMYILDSLILFIPKHYIELKIGAEKLGYYGTVTIVIVALSTLGSSVWSSIIPYYSTCFSFRKTKDIKRVSIIIIVILFALSILLLTVGRLTAPYIYRLLFGETIIDYMFLLPTVFYNSLLLLYNSFFSCFLIPLKKNSIFAFSDFVCVVILIPLCNYMCDSYQLSGASYSLTIVLFLKFMLLCICSIISIKNYLNEIV